MEMGNPPFIDDYPIKKSVFIGQVAVMAENTSTKFPRAPVCAKQ
jgi:hypothetical protein